MKKLSLVLLFISSSILAQTYQLTCDYEFEKEYVWDEITRDFTVTADMQDGKATFKKRLKNMSNYFFPNTQYPVAEWHNDSELIFKAVLEDNVITYSIVHTNYLRSKEELSVVYSTKKSVKLDELADEDEDSFDIYDGTTIQEYKNSEPYIKSNGVTIDECSIELI